MRCALISVAGGNEGCVMTLDGGGGMHMVAFKPRR